MGGEEVKTRHVYFGTLFVKGRERRIERFIEGREENKEYVGEEN